MDPHGNFSPFGRRRLHSRSVATATFVPSPCGNTPRIAANKTRAGDRFNRLTLLLLSLLSQDSTATRRLQDIRIACCANTPRKALCYLEGDLLSGIVHSPMDGEAIFSHDLVIKHSVRDQAFNKRSTDMGIRSVIISVECGP